MTMEKHKPTSEDSEARQAGDGNNASGTNPSLETRFQKGRSGNPSGRPKGSRNRAKIVEAILNEKVTIRDGARTRKLPKFEIMVTRMVNDAVKGDPKAQAQVMSLLSKYSLIDSLPEPDVAKPLTADDDALFADIAARHGFSKSDVSGGNDQTAAAPSKLETLQ